MAEQKINGQTYKVEPMLASEAVVLQARLARVLGLAMAKLPAIIASRGKDSTSEQRARADSEAVVAIAEIFGQRDPHEIGELVKDITELALVQRSAGAYEPVDFDLDFTGRLGDLIPVVVFVLKVQFGDFFSAALGAGRQLGRAKG